VEQLEGKVAVVTGAASGIGLAMAQRFAAEGMRLVLADIEEAALEGVAKQLVDTGTEVLALPTDVSETAAVDGLAAAARERFGTYHVVCNNAGVGGHGFASWAGPREEWEWVLGVNLWSVIDGIRAFVPALVEQNEGHIVNTASVAGLGAIPFMGPYSAAKHAVVAISEALHHELAMSASEVGVTVLCPGFVKTRIDESTRNWLGRLGPEPTNASPMGELMEQVVKNAVAAGAPTESLAQQVIDAIRDRQFLVTTDLRLASAAADNRRAEVDGVAPVLPPLI
jgi:NAD(P)-dependent dehydrogenase (short-subunit alcohol dehydrogenase family)